MDTKHQGERQTVGAIKLNVCMFKKMTRVATLV